MNVTQDYVLRDLTENLVESILGNPNIDLGCRIVCLKNALSPKRGAFFKTLDALYSLEAVKNEDHLSLLRDLMNLHSLHWNIGDKLRKILDKFGAVYHAEAQALIDEVVNSKINPVINKQVALQIRDWEMIEDQIQPNRDWRYELKAHPQYFFDDEQREYESLSIGLRETINYNKKYTRALIRHGLSFEEIAAFEDEQAYELEVTLQSYWLIIFLKETYNIPLHRSLDEDTLQTLFEDKNELIFELAKKYACTESTISSLNKKLHEQFMRQFDIPQDENRLLICISYIEYMVDQYLENLLHKTNELSLSFAIPIEDFMQFNSTSLFLLHEHIPQLQDLLIKLGMSFDEVLKNPCGVLYQNLTDPHFFKEIEQHQDAIESIKNLHNKALLDFLSLNRSERAELYTKATYLSLIIPEMIPGIKEMFTLAPPVRSLLLQNILGVTSYRRYFSMEKLSNMTPDSFLDTLRDVKSLRQISDGEGFFNLQLPEISNKRELQRDDEEMPHKKQCF